MTNTEDLFLVAKQFDLEVTMEKAKCTECRMDSRHSDSE
jgi:hypothetical protein